MTTTQNHLASTKKCITNCGGDMAIVNMKIKKRTVGQMVARRIKIFRCCKSCGQRLTEQHRYTVRNELEIK
jgi:hypothetical protein